MEKMSKNLNDTCKSKYEDYYFGKAPRLTEQKTVLIGLIDASGSMSSCWPTLVEEWNLIVQKHSKNIHTIIFSSDSTIVESKILTRSHVGGGTNICKGFEKLNELLIRLSESEKDFTVVFISDGDDGNMGTISKRIQELHRPAGININLICVGVGAGFPTFIAMELREKYHVGLSSIPAVFLVSDYKTDFAINFSSINDNYLLQLQKLSVNQAVRSFPWSNEDESEIFETASFITRQEKVSLNGVEVLTTKCDQLKKSEIEDIFKLWTQELQLASLKGNVRSQAGITVELMEFIYNQYDSKQLKESNSKTTMTVMERLEFRDKKSGIHLIQSLISECKKMREGVSLKDLTAEEAAKRLAIGTQQGKYHNKALNMRGIDQGDFENFKESFIKQLENTKLNDETSQEPSFILLQTQKDIFTETNLVEAVKRCKNAYELVEVFPMVGHTLFIRRTNASMINPYSVDVLSIPKINKVCDTVSLISQGNEMEISIGHEEEEKFNAVIPLFDLKADGDLRQLLRTKLFNLLMTFNVMKNADTFYPDAYAGLLANTLVRLLKYEDSKWKNEMINLIYSTAELVYGEQQYFEQSVNMLANDSRGAMVTEHKTEKHKCEDISKMILNLLVLTKRGLVDQNKASEIIRFMLIEHVGRFIKEDTECFEIYSGVPTLEDFQLKLKKTNKEEQDKQKNNTDDLKEQNNISSPNSEIQFAKENPTVVDVNSINQINTVPSNSNKINNKIINEKNENFIDINSISEEIKPKTLEEIIERFLINREHLKFNSIKDLKANLKKVFLEFNNREKTENTANIRLSKSVFNKPGHRINFSFFNDLHNYFCADLGKFDSVNFWIAINHALKYKDSNDRSINNIEMNYDSIREKLTKNVIEKQNKELTEKLYDGFEKSIVNNYLEDYKNSLKMIKDFDCNTELFKENALYDPNKPAFNIIFFGPSKSGKSSLAGRILVDLKCVDTNLFEYYKKAYQTFYPQKQNQPYEWLSNTSADERCKDKTIVLNISHINTENKFINIYDTPGCYKYYKKTISAMSLVDHYCLCLEADLDKIKKEIPIITASLARLAANDCTDLNIVLTKLDINYLESDQVTLNKVIMSIEELFQDLLTKLNLKLKLTITPLSSYSGYNIKSFISLLDNMKSHEEKNKFEDKCKLLVLDTIDDKFDGKIIYCQVFGKKLNLNSDFVSYPSRKEGKIAGSQINYRKVSEAINPGHQVSIRLNNSAKSLSIESGSILHINENNVDDKTKKMRIKNMTINLKYVGKTNITQRTCIAVEYKYFRGTFQVTKINDMNGNIIECTKEVKAGESIELSIIPTQNIYFENLWKDKTDFIIIRGPHYKLYGVGKMINITTEKY